MTQKQKTWYSELDRLIDVLPCPYCLNGCTMVNYHDCTSNECYAFNCRNENCYVFSEWILLKNYYKEFERVIRLKEMGFTTFPKKVINFANNVIN